MKLVFALLAVALLTSCDAWFVRHMSVAGSGEDEVLQAIRTYADEEGIPCDDSASLPIECWEQPIRIWAVQMDGEIGVCYSAMGIPLESDKFEEKMDRLESMLRQQVGGRISVSDQLCPTPPSRAL